MSTSKRRSLFSLCLSLLPLLRLDLQIYAREQERPLPGGKLHQLPREDMQLVERIVRVVAFGVPVLDQFFASSTSSCISVSKLLISLTAWSRAAY